MFDIVLGSALEDSLDLSLYILQGCFNNEVTMKGVGKIARYQSTTKHEYFTVLSHLALSTHNRFCHIYRSSLIRQSIIDLHASILFNFDLGNIYFHCDLN